MWQSSPDVEITNVELKNSSAKVMNFNRKHIYNFLGNLTVSRKKMRTPAKVSPAKEVLIYCRTGYFTWFIMSIGC